MSDQDYKPMENLKATLITYTGDGPYQCSQCFKIIKLKGSIHTGERPYHCSQCEKAFSTKGNLKTHMMIHMNTHAKEKSYKCNPCYKGFKHNIGFKAHMHNLTRENPFQCSQCDKGFANNITLKRHIMKMHTMLRLFRYDVTRTLWQCNQCGIFFSSVDDSIRHMPTHKNNINFISQNGKDQTPSEILNSKTIHPEQDSENRGDSSEIYKRKYRFEEKHNEVLFSCSENLSEPKLEIDAKNEQMIIKDYKVDNLNDTEPNHETVTRDVIEPNIEVKEKQVDYEILQDHFNGPEIEEKQFCSANIKFKMLETKVEIKEEK